MYEFKSRVQIYCRLNPIFTCSIITLAIILTITPGVKNAQRHFWMPLNGPEGGMDLSCLKPGIYIIYIQSRKGSFAGKILVV